MGAHAWTGEGPFLDLLRTERCTRPQHGQLATKQNRRVCANAIRQTWSSKLNNPAKVRQVGSSSGRRPSPPGAHMQ
eukprot:7457415-Alexandrium_andersonii.AAC.1